MCPCTVPVFSSLCGLQNCWTKFRTSNSSKRKKDRDETVSPSGQTRTRLDVSSALELACYPSLLFFSGLGLTAGLYQLRLNRLQRRFRVVRAVCGHTLLRALPADATVLRQAGHGVAEESVTMVIHSRDHKTCLQLAEHAQRLPAGYAETDVVRVHRTKLFTPHFGVLSQRFCSDAGVSLLRMYCLGSTGTGSPPGPTPAMMSFSRCERLWTTTDMNTTPTLKVVKR